MALLCVKLRFRIFRDLTEYPNFGAFFLQIHFHIYLAAVFSFLPLKKVSLLYKDNHHYLLT